MKNIYIKCEYTLCKKNGYSESDKNYTFTKILNGITAEAEISYSQHTVIVKLFGATLLEKHIEELRNLNHFDGEKLSVSCQDAISTIKCIASQFAKEILELIKYHLCHDDIQENLIAIKSEKWGETSTKLQEIPSSFNVIISGDSISPLQEDSYQSLVESLNAEVVPLLAMRHLHRAKHENSPHHKWIDATIAAELAIKEVLSRAKPELETLLLNMPSPPLSKLYGNILKTYLGETSPYKKALTKGAEVRNQLVHRHDSSAIDDQSAVDYVKDVERAIFHLLTLLYPNDLLIKTTYNYVML